VSVRPPALWLAAVALWVAAVGLSVGAVAAFCAAPLALWLMGCAASLRHSLTPDQPRRLVGAGAATALLGAGFAIAGAPAAGLVTVVLGATLAAHAARLARRFDPLPEGISPPASSRSAETIAGALDEGAKLWWEVTRSIQRPRDAQLIAANVRAAAHRNHEEGWTDYPVRSHLPPPPLEKAAVRILRVPGVGRAQHLSFASEFEPQDPEIRSAYLDMRANRTAHAYLWRHRDGLRPTLVCVHGHGMGRISLDARVWSVDWLHRELGIDIALFVLPLYGARSQGRRSGAGFLDGHPLWTSAAVSQAVWDLRRIGGWLRAEGASLVGSVGVGLGGCVASVLASVDESLACVVPIMPVVPLENLFWSQLSRSGRAELRASGLTPHQLTRAWARNSPLRMRPRVGHDARLIIGGAADRVVPPTDVEALWEHWGRPAIHWSPGSHFGWTDRQNVRDRLASHLRSSFWPGSES